MIFEGKCNAMFHFNFTSNRVDQSIEERSLGNASILQQILTLPLHIYVALQGNLTVSQFLYFRNGVNGSPDTIRLC